MKRFVMIAGLGLLAATPALAQAKFPIAADGTTNINDCLKAPADARNNCISRARPMNTQALMAFTKGREALEKKAAAAAPAKAGVVAKAVDTSKTVDKSKARAAAKAAAAAAARYNKARVASAPKGLKVAADGSTDINQCSSVGATLFNACISRARPLNTAQLMSFTKQRTAAAAKLAASKATTKVVAAKPEPKPAEAKKAEAKKAEVKKVEAKAAAAVAAPTKILDVKGFLVAKDGTTNIGDCAKAKAEFKNECISRARPVSGAQIYGKSARGGS